MNAASTPRSLDELAEDTAAEGLPSIGGEVLLTARDRPWLDRAADMLNLLRIRAGNYNVRRSNSFIHLHVLIAGQ